MTSDGAGERSFFDSLFGLHGTTALVTGASRGLGAAMALALGRAGAKVCLVGRSANLGSTRRSLEAVDADTLEVVGDQGTEAGVDAIVSACEDGLGPVDILVNNAGTFARKPALDWTLDEWDEVVDLSTRSVFMMCQRVGRGMLDRGRGKIINIGSVLSFQGGSTVAGYAASRHALVGLTRSLATEWARHGINVNAIAPGYFDTDLLDGLKADPQRSQELLSRVPAGRWGQPDELAGAVIYLASAASRFVHGATLTVDGGWLAR